MKNSPQLQESQIPALLTVPDAVEFTKTFTGTGKAALTRESLYAMARMGQVKTVGSKRRMFIIRESLERVLRGEA